MALSTWILKTSKDGYSITTLIFLITTWMKKKNHTPTSFAKKNKNQTPNPKANQNQTPQNLPPHIYVEL